MTGALRIFALLVMKDIKTELRGRHFLIGSVAFGILLMMVFGMAVGSSQRLTPDFSAGILWTALFFSTTVCLHRYDASDRELSAWVGLMLAPFDRSLIYYAKWVSTFLFVFVVDVAVSVSFFLILNQSVPVHLVGFLVVLCGGTLGISGVGTFLSTLVAPSKMRDVLLPVMMFPLSIPLFLAVIHLTIESFGQQIPGMSVWVEIAVGYIVCFCVLPWLLFEVLMEV